jgi:hypothetical protein
MNTIYSSENPIEHFTMLWAKCFTFNVKASGKWVATAFKRVNNNINVLHHQRQPTTLIWV